MGTVQTLGLPPLQVAELKGEKKFIPWARILVKDLSGEGKNTDRMKNQFKNESQIRTPNFS